jgi:predicted HD phosphohydrolase
MGWTAIHEATEADWRNVEQVESGLPDEATVLLKIVADARDFPPYGYPISLYDHSLQTATRCLRAGEDDEIVVAALVHDALEPIATRNHGAVAAAVLAPFLREEVVWLVKNHGVIQDGFKRTHPGIDHAAVAAEIERLSAHPHFALTERFCRTYDEISFDPAYDSLPLEAFEDVVRRVVDRAPVQH